MSKPLATVTLTSKELLSMVSTRILNQAPMLGCWDHWQADITMVRGSITIDIVGVAEAVADGAKP